MREEISGVLAIGALDDGGDDFIKLPVIDAFEVGAISGLEDGNGYFGANLSHDGFSGALFGLDHCLVERLI